MFKIIIFLLLKYFLAESKVFNVNSFDSQIFCLLHLGFKNLVLKFLSTIFGYGLINKPGVPTFISCEQLSRQHKQRRASEAPHYWDSKEKWSFPTLTGKNVSRDNLAE